jgi:L-threonylcarbamoyladenylate synthase
MEKTVAGYLTTARSREVAAILSAGGVAILPTDTIYGFHCAASAHDAVERIRKLKGSKKRVGFILLVSDIGMVDAVVSGWPPGAREHLASVWPAPLTVILPASRTLAPVIAPRRTVAVRVPDLRGLRILIRRVGEPLISTSVNRAGGRPLTKIGEIRREFPGLDAYISRRGGHSRKPSTVVDFTRRPCTLVRSGRYLWRR